MRVNIYAEEMTDRIEIVSKEIDGQTFTGLRFYLYLPASELGRDASGNVTVVKQHQGPFIHRIDDDDSSAVTFWGKKDLRVAMREALAVLDAHYGAAKGNKTFAVEEAPSDVGIADEFRRPPGTSFYAVVAREPVGPPRTVAVCARRSDAEEVAAALRKSLDAPTKQA